MKRCQACSAAYSPEEWLKLPLVGFQPYRGEELEFRRCTCGTLLSIDLLTEPTIACCRRCTRSEPLRPWRGIEVCAECEYELAGWAMKNEAYARALAAKRVA